MISDESTLMVVIVGLYLYDSVLMLNTNEAVLVRVRSGRWFAAFGSANYRLAGKEPYLPNPFTPHRRMYRLAWSEAPTGSNEGKPDRSFLHLNARGPIDLLALLLYPAALALFVMLPLGLFSRLGIVCTLAAVGLFYFTAIGLVAAVWLNRHTFGITSRQAASMAIQCLACPPFAINLIRKICAAHRKTADFMVVAPQVLRPAQMEGVFAQCLRRLDEQIDFEPEGTKRSLAMAEGRGRFQPQNEDV